MEGVSCIPINRKSTLWCSNASHEEYGAVSSQVARALSEGMLSRANTDWSLSVTGIAGPTGGSPENRCAVYISAPQNTRQKKDVQGTVKKSEPNGHTGSCSFTGKYFS